MAEDLIMAGNIGFYLHMMLEDLLYDTLEAREEVSNKSDHGDLGVLMGRYMGRYRAMKIFLDQAEKYGIKDKLPPKLRDLNLEELLDIAPKS